MLNYNFKKKKFSSLIVKHLPLKILFDFGGLSSFLMLELLKSSTIKKNEIINIIAIV